MPGKNTEPIETSRNAKVMPLTDKNFKTPSIIVLSMLKYLKVTGEGLRFFLRKSKSSF